jgi:hypothetical protein
MITRKCQKLKQEFEENYIRFIMDDAKYNNSSIRHLMHYYKEEYIRKCSKGKDDSIEKILLPPIWR